MPSRFQLEEKPGAGAEKADAANKKVGASTEISIVPPKTFAAPSEKDDAPAEKIVSSHGKMFASCGFLDAADN